MSKLVTVTVRMLATHRLNTYVFTLHLVTGMVVRRGSTVSKRFPQISIKDKVLKLKPSFDII